MKYALIKGGAVVNVIEAEAGFAATLTGYDDVIEAGDAGIGWLWDGASLAPPVPQEPSAQPQAERRCVTRLAFRNRFTLVEKAALELAALDNPAADMAARAVPASLRAYMKDVDAATFIDLDNPDARAGVQMLEAMGLLAAGRAAQIVDAPVREEERYTGALQ
ncbi:MAG: hypothetical protein LBI48_11500 [Burkholderiaceae bacterium]|jgi:hypothetical protein|nr:hypothetical protein [Burkholderiaceae bacterium]